MEVGAAELADIAMTHKGQGLAEVYFALTEDDAAQFGDMTSKLVGDKMTVEVCGHLLADPVVMMPIEGGQVTVTGGMELMTELFSALKADRPCPDPES